MAQPVLARCGSAGRQKLLNSRRKRGGPYIQNEDLVIVDASHPNIGPGEALSLRPGLAVFACL